MAKKRSSFSVRFPHFGKILFLALIISLGITVYSFQNAPTNLKQEAATSCSSIGGGCVSYGRDCASGYTSTNYYCSSGVCCLPTVTSAPANLSASYNSCILYGETFTVNIYLSWGSVSNATNYSVHWYDTVYGKLVGQNSKLVTGTSTSIYPSIPTGGRFYWYVKGYNKYSKIYGPKSTTKEIIFSCNKI